MAEYIDREVAKKALGDAHFKNYGNAIMVIMDIPTADVRPVVLCRDCYWWTKQEASMQGRCSRLGMYPTGNWYCANGQKRREER